MILLRLVALVWATTKARRTRLGAPAVSLAVLLLGCGDEGKRTAALSQPGAVLLVSASEEFAGGTSELFSGGGPLYLVSVSGGEPIPIPGTDGLDSPSWLPDGKTFAASDFESGSQIELLKPDGHGRATLPIQTPFGVAWSPDGRRLVYQPEGGPLTIASASGKPISTLPSGNSPDWSPDGKRIVFQSRGTGLGQLRIFVIDVDGRNQRQLTIEGGVDGDTSPVWSPDGTRIAFVSDRDGDEEIEVMNSDGTHRRALTSNDVTDCCPTWSPDGTQIAFVRGAAEDGVIYIVNEDGTGERALVGPHPAVITKLAWQPVPHS